MKPPEALAQSGTVPLPALAIIAGLGQLPRLLMDACAAQNRPYCIVLLEDSIDAETVTKAGEYGLLIKIGQIGKALEFMRGNHATEVVLAGKITRPKLTNLRTDATGARLLARIGKSLFSGDNTLLSEIVGFLEEEGIKVVGSEDVLHDLIAPEGLIGSVYPDKQAQADIDFGARIARAIGALDIGQAVVVQKQHVLGVEAIEGTDALIARAGQLKFDEKGGVLVKMKKPQQERRVDLPTIGVTTVEQVAAAGLSGIAVESGGALILDRREVARRADALGVFVVGFSVTESE
jgi:DUF1009 family protein